MFSCLSAGSIYFFNNYPLTLIPTHLAFSISIFSICTALSLTTVILFRKSINEKLQPLIFSITTTIFIFLYLANALSNYFWKANINLNLVNRMITHYFSLYKVETILIIGLIPLISVFIVYIPFRRLFLLNHKVISKPRLGVFYYSVVSAILLIQVSSLNINYGKKSMRDYFSGEMFIDLFTEYTDAHQDYIAEAGSIKDIVKQTQSYIPQTADRIDPTKKNIVVIVIDCLRADHLSSYGYDRNTTPFINELTKKHKTAQIKNTFSICDESKCGIRSILTSRGLKSQNLPEASQNSLHKNLSDNGYQINFLLTSDHAFGGLKRIYSPYDFYLDGIGFNSYPLNDDRGIISTLEQWPDYNGTPNYFHFHLFSAHEASIKYGKFLGKGVHGIEAGFLKGDPISPRFSSNTTSNKQTIMDVMDNKLYQSDLIYSRIHTLLSNKGYMDNTIIIITGDHGQGLNEHGYLGHVKGLHNESLRIPLIIIDTSGDNVVLEESMYATQLDIAPTVLTLMDMPSPHSWEGLALQKAKTEVTIMTHKIPNRSKSYAKILYNPSNNSLYKYIFMSTLSGFKEERYFYDLINDPTESNNLLELTENIEKYEKLISDWHLDTEIIH